MKKILALCIFFLIISLLLSSSPIYAQREPGRHRPPSGNGGVGGGLSITNLALSDTLLNILAGEDPGLVFLRLLLSNLIILVFIIAALVFFFMFIFGGIQWITSGGDKGATESAKGRITAALIGLVIVFSVYAILNLINTLTGVDLTDLDISQLFLE